MSVHDALDCNHSYHDNANHSFVSTCNDGYMESIGKRIRALREKAGFSQDELAQRVSVSRVAVTKWESGETANIKLHNLEKLKATLRVSFDELIQGRPTPGGVSEASPIYEAKSSPEELALLDAWRTGDDMTKAMLRTIIDTNLKKRRSAA